ncbi:LamG domain-containing protein [Paenibacillus sp. HWE-109]|uniref:LamG domain-containing protein n=1 Tax=Paenibacillus sp. HWE-109 TaxID=1306526 RepID=UPI001EE0EF04|nr:LamG domain-containing protein [Paenibacillus sp. HWE-109]UKS30988.1 LamG domain-containing protein [Paenibacillus sp. HWE-109]
MTTLQEAILQTPSLVSFWDFQEEDNFHTAQGPFPYVLEAMSGPIKRVEDGVLGAGAVELAYGQWFRLPRSECPALDFHGSDAKLTLIAWIKRNPSDNPQCEAIAGMWNESEKKRQYAMFLNLRIWDSQDQVCGHVSAEGGPTPGYPWCMSTAIGATPVAKDEWHTIAFTYDGSHAKVYLDGLLDEREQYNPYFYDQGLYDGGSSGADFTVGAVHRSGEMGNFYAGLLGGLAVFQTALPAEQIRKFSLNVR